MADESKMNQSLAAMDHSETAEERAVEWLIFCDQAAVKLSAYSLLRVTARAELELAGRKGTANLQINGDKFSWLGLSSKETLTYYLPLPLHRLIRGSVHVRSRDS